MDGARLAGSPHAQPATTVGVAPAAATFATFAAAAFVLAAAATARPAAALTVAATAALAFALAAFFPLLQSCRLHNDGGARQVIKSHDGLVAI